MSNKIRELDIDDLNGVNGGMKWTAVKNDDVIDARGGLLTIFGVTFSLDTKGNVSVSW